MTLEFKRLRRRIIPTKKLGSQKLGGYFSMTTQGGVPTGKWSTVEINKQFFNYQAPYSKASFIADTPHKGPPYYDGDPFQMVEVDYTDPYNGVHGAGTYIRSDGMEKYVGGFSPPSNAAFLGSPDISNPNTFLVPLTPLVPDLSVYGIEAWRKTKPKIEYADAYVFLKELKDAVHMSKSTGKIMRDSYDRILVTSVVNEFGPGASPSSRVVKNALKRYRQTKMMSPRYVGDQFLNHQFGWVPFLSDLRKFNSAYTNFIEINARITQRNGQWRRRKITVHEEKTESRLGAGSGSLLSPFLASGYYSTDPNWEVLERITYKVQSVGSFRYYLREFDMNSPDYSSEWFRMMRQLDIFGARVSPINVYRAVPWTWANDWLNDSSAYLEYASDAVMNNLACKYFYLMGHWTREIVIRQNLPLLTQPKVLEFTRKIESKTRLEAASPFDFSLSWSGLNPRQLAIAAALGITRSH